MDYLPLFARMSHAPCLIVGGGAVAARKSRLLLRAGAKISVIDPDPCDELAALANAGEICLLATEFTPDILATIQPVLIIAATDSRAVNSQVAKLAADNAVLCNVVDDRELSSAILPAIVDRSPVIIAVSTGGRSPVLATQLRQKLETLLPANFGRLAIWADRWRERIKQNIDKSQNRLHLWQEILDGTIADQVLDEDEINADLRLQELLEQREENSGIAWLVGAGPGDPELLTLKALRCIQKADVIVHDRLINSAILDHMRRDAQLIPVGKQAGQVGIKQSEINQLLIELVKQGLRVCRLKGGDPFIFGRGGEEMRALQEAGLPCKIVPGVTAASGCAAAAGVPLTHREIARSVTLVTAHTANDNEPDWQSLASSEQTVALYMSVRGLASACSNLIAAGRDENCPVLLIENGTTQHQREIQSTLSRLPTDPAAKNIQSPALLIVGDVAALGQPSRLDFATDESSPWLPPAAANTNVAAGQ